MQNSGQQYAILSQSNQLQQSAQYIQIAAPQVNEVWNKSLPLIFHQKIFLQTMQQQHTTAPMKNIHLSTTPNVIQQQQRPATSAHVRLNSTLKKK